MTIRPIALALCLPLLIALAACGKKADDAKVAATGTAVLAGTISDAMIDLDTSTASPPMEPIKAEAKAKASVEATDVAAESASPAEAADAPAESADTE